MKLMNKIVKTFYTKLNVDKRYKVVFNNENSVHKLILNPILKKETNKINKPTDLGEQIS